MQTYGYPYVHIYLYTHTPAAAAAAGAAAAAAGFSLLSVPIFLNIIWKYETHALKEAVEVCVCVYRDRETK
jgi:hypothetical protein